MSGFNGGGCFWLCVQGFDRGHALDLAAFGPTMFLGFWGYIRFCGAAAGGFAFTASHFCRRPKVTKTLGPGVRPSPWLGFLCCGVHPGAAPTVCFAAPPLAVFDFVERSLRSHPRMNPSTQPAEGAGTARSRAAAELTLILLSGEEHAVGFCFSVGVSLLAMAAWQPTSLQVNAPNPTVGVSLLAIAS